MGAVTILLKVHRSPYFFDMYTNVLPENVYMYMCTWMHVYLPLYRMRSVLIWRGGYRWRPALKWNLWAHYDTHSTHCYIKTSSGKLNWFALLCVVVSKFVNFFCEYAHLHCSLVISLSHWHIHVDLWVGQRFGDWTMYLLHALLPSFLPSPPSPPSLPPSFISLPPPSVSPEHQIQDVWIRHPDRRW